MPVPQASPVTGADVTTASIAKPPKIKRKKRTPDVDPDWNTNPLH